MARRILIAGYVLIEVEVEGSAAGTDDFTRNSMGEETNRVQRCLNGIARRINGQLRGSHATFVDLSVSALPDGVPHPVPAMRTTTR